MLVFSAIVPHPPIIIPNIGKENIEKVKSTIDAMNVLAQDIETAKPDVIITISPHGNLLPDAFTININNSYTADFEQFGDFETTLEFGSDLELAGKIKERIESELPIMSVNQDKLDHGVSVPLFYLAQNLENVKIIPINYSLLSPQEHVQFGQLLKEIIAESNKKIAVIASGDLSHCLTKDAPASFAPEGEKFDSKLIELLKKKNTKGMLNMDSVFVDKAAECGYRSILILMGILQDINCQTIIHSYEGPFGVGYLVANFKLQ